MAVCILPCAVITAIVSFLLVALALFFVVKAYNPDAARDGYRLPVGVVEGAGPDMADTFNPPPVYLLSAGPATRVAEQAVPPNGGLVAVHAPAHLA